MSDGSQENENAVGSKNALDKAAEERTFRASIISCRVHNNIDGFLKILEDEKFDYWSDEVFEKLFELNIASKSEYLPRLKRIANREFVKKHFVIAMKIFSHLNMRDEVIACSGALFAVGDDEWAMHGFNLAKCDKLCTQSALSNAIDIFCGRDILKNFQPFCKMLDRAANLGDAKDVFEELYRLMSLRRVDNVYIYILLFKARELNVEMGYSLLSLSTQLILSFELHRLSILVDIFVHLQDVENLKLVVETRLDNASIYHPRNSDIQKRELIASKILALKSFQDYPALDRFC